MFANCAKTVFNNIVLSHMVKNIPNAKNFPFMKSFCSRAKQDFDSHRNNLVDIVSVIFAYRSLWSAQYIVGVLQDLLDDLIHPRINYHIY